MTLVLSVHKAMPALKAEPVQDLAVSIKEEIPDFKELGTQDDFTLHEAKCLESALYNTLPGATYDRLLCEMLKRKVTHFRVPHSDYSVKCACCAPEEGEKR